MPTFDPNYLTLSVVEVNLHELVEVGGRGVPTEDTLLHHLTFAKVEGWRNGEGTILGNYMCGGSVTLLIQILCVGGTLQSQILYVGGTLLNQILHVGGTFLSQIFRCGGYPPKPNILCMGVLLKANKSNGPALVSFTAITSPCLCTSATKEVLAGCGLATAMRSHHQCVSLCHQSQLQENLNTDLSGRRSQHLTLTEKETK